MSLCGRNIQHHQSWKPPSQLPLGNGPDCSPRQLLHRRASGAAPPASVIMHGSYIKEGEGIQTDCLVHVPLETILAEQTTIPLQAA
ncbi:hypothetical protein BLNAU_24873 [Blattamonas nauphoetae]|uniref:Uncharacterized protein n=1 Tax=Blattamonas nauphoetae TaxID=2049346 RepID=A0ABQ9WLM7_9EUKA|nr:hypothetical protein BLNAU_24873 [Blattamonas nauphoetae]